MLYLPIAQTVSMVMTIATNCSNTRSRISLWDRFGEPPRIMLISPNSSTNATAATARGSRIELRKDAIGRTYHRAGRAAIGPMQHPTIWLFVQ